MKIVFNTQNLNKELKKLKEGESILLHERRVSGWQGMMEFQKYLYKILMLSRPEDLEIYGGLIFKKNEK